MKVIAGEEGYIKTPGYPLYYVGNITCGWTFTTLPGQRIVLTFHDLNILGKPAPVNDSQPLNLSTENATR